MKIFGAALLAIGILVAGLSGLCSLVVLVDGPLSATLVGVVVVGGIPFLVGLGLIVIGLHLLKQQA